MKATPQESEARKRVETILKIAGKHTGNIAWEIGIQAANALVELDKEAEESRIKLRPASEYHEDYYTVLWFHFYDFESEPEVYLGNGLGTDFDDEHWTHFLQLNFNSVIEQAERLGVRL
jgi:hypothetical protein